MGNSFNPENWGWEKQGEDSGGTLFYETEDLGHQPFSLYRKGDEWTLGRGYRHKIDSQWQMVYKGPIDEDQYRSLASIFGLPKTTREDYPSFCKIDGWDGKQSWGVDFGQEVSNAPSGSEKWPILFEGTCPNCGVETHIHAEPAHDIAWAVAAMKAGKKVRRKGWTPGHIQIEGINIIWTSISGWRTVDPTITAEDLMATDWELYKGEQ